MVEIATFILTAIGGALLAPQDKPAIKAGLDAATLNEIAKVRERLPTKTQIVGVLREMKNSFASIDLLGAKQVIELAKDNARLQAKNDQLEKERATAMKKRVAGGRALEGTWENQHDPKSVVSLEWVSEKESLVTMKLHQTDGVVHIVTVNMNSKLVTFLTPTATSGVLPGEDDVIVFNTGYFMARPSAKYPKR